MVPSGGERAVQAPMPSRTGRRERPGRVTRVGGGSTSPSGSWSRPAALRRGLRRTGAPQDRALYACACGQAFSAAVSATVACAACGRLQDW